MLSASVRTAMAVNPGALVRMRMPYRRCCSRFPMHVTSWKRHQVSAGSKISFMPQRDHGIHAHGLTRGEVTSGNHDADQEQGDRNKRQRVNWLHAKQQRRHDTSDD